VFPGADTVIAAKDAQSSPAVVPITHVTVFPGKIMSVLVRAGEHAMGLPARRNDNSVPKIFFVPAFLMVTESLEDVTNSIIF